MKKLLLFMIMLCIPCCCNAMNTDAPKEMQRELQQELPDEFLQFDKEDVVALLSRSNSATLLAYLCHTITKEEARIRVSKILATATQSISSEDENGLWRICASENRFSPTKKAAIVRECFTRCWARSGDGESSGCAFYNPTPLEVVQRKIKNGCKAESCLYVYQQFKEFEETRAKQQALRVEQEKQARKKGIEAEYEQIVGKFKGTK
jgi:hypothetical protein